jgi:hypothetical protein
MQRIKSTFVILFVSTSLFTHAQTINESSIALGLNTGYNGGFGVQLSATALKPLQSLPVQLRLGIGYNKLDAGSAADARRIFINNATNGVPEEKAKSFDYRLDFLWSSSLLSLEEAYLVVGPRYSSYTANFKYVGGNEDFDVTSKQFGLGLGAESHFPISKKLNLVAAAGMDYFFNNTLQGHDTSYSPDNDNVNPRNDNQNNDVQFTYTDANDAVNQPNFMPRVLLGIQLKI